MKTLLMHCFHRFGLAGDLARVEKIYDRMQQDNISPTAHTFTALANAFMRHGTPTSSSYCAGEGESINDKTVSSLGSPYGVVEIWRRFKKSLVPPDLKLFYTFVCGMGAEQAKNLVDLFWYMKNQRLNCTSFLYARIIDALNTAKLDNEVLVHTYSHH